MTLATGSVTAAPGLDWRGKPARANLGPWSGRDVARMAFFAGLGIIGAVICWSAAAHKVTYPDQVPWLVGSIACTGLIVLSLAYWLVLGFRQVRIAAHDTFTLLVISAPLAERERETAPEMPALDSRQTLVTGTGMRRVHLAGCQLAQGKPGLHAVTRSYATRHHLQPCGVCRP